MSTAKPMGSGERIAIYAMQRGGKDPVLTDKQKRRIRKKQRKASKT